MVIIGSAELNTALPATSTFTPASNSFGALSMFTPPSI